eukprot:scaffold649_cov347-Pavlova_lutheri.AAC.137
MGLWMSSPPFGLGSASFTFFDDLHVLCILHHPFCGTNDFTEHHPGPSCGEAARRFDTCLIQTGNVSIVPNHVQD